MTTTFKLGVHAVLMADVAAEGSSEITLALGTKVFIFSLEPLTVSTAEGVLAQVEPEQIRTTRGRPKRIGAPMEAPVASALVVTPEVTQEPAIEASDEITDLLEQAAADILG